MKYFLLLFSILITTTKKTVPSKSIKHLDLCGESISCLNSSQEKAVILFLNGYNFSVQKALNESNFLENALDRGYSIVMPEVKKTVYAKKIIPRRLSSLFLRKTKLLYRYVNCSIYKYPLQRKTHFYLWLIHWCKRHFAHCRGT